MERIQGFCTTLLEALGISLWFLLSNLPFFSFYLFVGIEEIEHYLFFFALCLLPLGPSLSALFYSMRRLMRDKDIAVGKTYRAGYRDNVKQSLILSAIQCGAICLLTVNQYAFSRMFPGYGFGFFFQILLLLVLLITPNLYLFQMRYDLNLLEIGKRSLVLMIGKPYLTLGNAAAFLCLLIAYQILPGIVLLAAPSVYAFLVLFMNRTWFLSKQNQEWEGAVDEKH